MSSGAACGGDGGNQRRVFIYATNYDGSPHWQHPAWLVSATDALIVTRTEPGLEVAHERGVWVDPFRTRGYYWPDRFYNVIRLEEPGRGSAPPRLNGFYCNVATPPEFDGETLRYIDLQLDVRVFAEPQGGLTPVILDEEEFELACRRYGYSDTLIARARGAVREVLDLVEGRAFPFDA